MSQVLILVLILAIGLVVGLVALVAGAWIDEMLDERKE